MFQAIINNFTPLQSLTKPMHWTLLDFLLFPIHCCSERVPMVFGCHTSERSSQCGHCRTHTLSSAMPLPDIASALPPFFLLSQLFHIHYTKLTSVPILQPSPQEHAWSPQHGPLLPLPMPPLLSFSQSLVGSTMCTKRGMSIYKWRP
jgi:hypothetical protein